MNAGPEPGSGSVDDGVDPVAVLSDALDRKAERIREIDARSRVTRSERDEARRERDRARARLERLSSRWVIRLMLGAGALARSLRAGRKARTARSSAPSAPPPKADPFQTGTVGWDAPVRPALRVEDPIAYRTALLDQLAERSAERLQVIAVDWTDPLEPEDGPADRGWRVRSFDPDGSDVADAGTAADVAVIGSPEFDPRRLPRHVVTVACPETMDPWLDRPWFESFDIVLVPDESARQAVQARTSKVASILPRDSGTRPARDAIRDALLAWVNAVRIAIMVQAPTWDAAETSGDYHFARGLQRQFERRGHPTSVYLRHQWPAAATAREEIVIHLWGRYPLATRSSQRTVLWVIYHPELLTLEVCRAYDHVFVASDTLATDLGTRFGVAAEALHQATDPERFRPTPGGRHHELLFVGNSRGVHRRILEDLLPTSHEIAVYGGGWTEDLLDPELVRGAGIANSDLAAAYGAADIVLNDHWVESAQAGLINNRLYDALAAGAFAISDEVPGIADEFDGGVVTYRGAADLALKIERYLADPAARQAVADRGRRAVLGRHTFAHRADRLLEVLADGRTTDGSSG